MPGCECWLELGSAQHAQQQWQDRSWHWELRWARLVRKGPFHSLYPDARIALKWADILTRPAVEVWDTRSPNLLHVCLKTEGANPWPPSTMPKEFVTNNDKAFIIRVRKMHMQLAAARRRRRCRCHASHIIAAV